MSRGPEQHVTVKQLCLQPPPAEIRLTAAFEYTAIWPVNAPQAEKVYLYREDAETAERTLLPHCGDSDASSRVGAGPPLQLLSVIHDITGVFVDTWLELASWLTINKNKSPARIQEDINK